MSKRDLPVEKRHPCHARPATWSLRRAGLAAARPCVRCPRGLGLPWARPTKASWELETAYEELQSTVEELETTNEELQSTNEELETTNEELQSTNEELDTMNDELRERTDETLQANAFLGSVLSSIQQGVVVVDRTLRI